MASITSKITAKGQSLWLDNIQRKSLLNGDLQKLIQNYDIRGITSNPTIFNNAIAKTSDYTSALTSLAWAGWDAEKIFWELAIEDIREACDQFMPVYEQTNGGDGYVSLEESPSIARDTQAAILQAQQLWARVGRPNLFIKIPATREGIPAIRRSIAAGINVNITLIFSLARYSEVMEAFLSGLEDRLASGQPINHIASVASFFVSRVDTKIDGLLSEASPLRGKAAIANAKLAYEKFVEVFKGERWEKLHENGARLQRPLWASTSTKNPSYPDTLYVDELIGPNTVNTLPPQTIEAVQDHAKDEITISSGLETARDLIDQLENQGIMMDRVTQELETEGVQAFADAFQSLIQTIDERRDRAVKHLGPIREKAIEEIRKLEVENFAKRIWQHDPSLWSSNPNQNAEIRSRLGWLDLPQSSLNKIDEIIDFADQVQISGIKKFLLLGMGGSSLAPEVYSRLFPNPEVQFDILDSTNPDQIRSSAEKFPPSESLYIASSKSGNTVEVNALLDYFLDLSGNNGSRFVAITDPGTPLDAFAKERGFRKCFHADPTVGGRFSALTAFGLVPAAFMRLDLKKILLKAAGMQKACTPDKPGARNPGLTLGAIFGAAAKIGRNKLTLIADDPISSVGSWLEQLVAESSGKDGKGILPVDMEPRGQPENYGNDRIFVYLRQNGKWDDELANIQRSGQPLIIIPMDDPDSIFEEIYRWEFAIVTACHMLGVNAFNQPDVQESKTRTKSILVDYLSTRVIRLPETIFTQNGIEIYSDEIPSGSGLAEVISNFLRRGKESDFIAINGFLPRTSSNYNQLQELRLLLREKTNMATTVGFGPRFLHSTGQFHKGGPNQGLYLMITLDPERDLRIPSQELTFGILVKAQALGDFQALTASNRRVLWFHLGDPGDMKLLIQSLLN